MKLMRRNQMCDQGGFDCRFSPDRSQAQAADLQRDKMSELPLSHQRVAALSRHEGFTHT